VTSGAIVCTVLSAAITSRYTQDSRIRHKLSPTGNSLPFGRERNGDQNIGKERELIKVFT
jgi:hypothetical protein